jgi:hypothetical protein
VSRPRRPVLERYFEMVIKGKTEDDCWGWRGATDEFGYARIALGGRGSLREFIHRFSYTMFNGEIPEGMVVRHKCDCPPCSNPRHLIVGTQSDNMQDCIARGRFASMPGFNNPRAKLTEEQVEEIRAQHLDGATRSLLASTFNVSDTTISRVVNHVRY